MHTTMATMTATRLKSDAKSSWRVLNLVIFWAVCLFIVAFAANAVGYSTMVQPKKCMLTVKIDYVSGVKASCSNLSLTSVPRDLPPNTITLLLDNNLLTNLTNNSFENLPQLVTLNLRSNFIYQLDTGAFLPLTQLKILDLTGNMLAQLPDPIFDSNPLLSHLILTSNRLKSVPSNELIPLHQLQYVSLGSNTIMKVNFSAFQHLKNISDIDISKNDIKSLTASDFEPLQNSSVNFISLANNQLFRDSLNNGTFSFLTQVGSLDLHGNKLQVFRLNPFLGNVSINKLSLFNCGISEFEPFNGSSFHKETLPSIYYIEMKQNCISFIPSCAFIGFNQTRKLNIAENKITNINNESFCGMDFLENLDISNNRLVKLSYGVFSCIPRLQVLNVANNGLLVLNPGYFQGLSVLHILDLSHNAMIYKNRHHNWSNPELQVLDLSHNSFRLINRDFIDGALQNFTILKISYNLIGQISPNAFDNVPSLRELYLENMLGSKPIQSLSGVFDNTNNLVKLRMSSTKIASLKPSLQFQGAASLEELSMCKNDLKIGNLFDSATNLSLFKGLTSLRKLTLRKNELKLLVPGVFQPLSTLLSLDLSNSKIETLEPGSFEGLISLKSLYLDDNYIQSTSANTFSGLGNLVSLFLKNSKLENLEPGTFGGLISLRNLYLNGNGITSTSANTLSGLDNLVSLYISNNLLRILDKHIFAATPNLHNLSLSSNRLRTVQKDTFFPKSNSTFFIDVSRNPLSCDCELSWFRTWLNENKTILVHAQETTCSVGSFNTVILEFYPGFLCVTNVIFITSLSLFVCIVIYMCVLVYYRQSWVRNKFVFLKHAIHGSGRVVENFKDGNYDFHLHLMFHDGEEEWMDRVMKPVLVKRFPNIQKIICGDRDLRLEMFYINAVYDAIENSFKTVLLISNRSLNDIWCITKLRLALEHVCDTGLDKFILIFIEDIREDDMPSLIKVFLSENKPHMWWTEDEDEQEIFWAEFHRRMKANRAATSATPLYL